MSKKNSKSRKSQRVADATEVDRKVRATPTSKWALDIQEILTLEPPEGWLIPVPEGTKESNFRRAVRAMVDSHVIPNSPYRYVVSLASARRILVSCKP